jgi:glycerol-3-phosphate acyltransferase PlsX
MRIAVDAMGGDHAPSVVVDGAVAAARHLDAEVVLVGPAADIERALAAHADWSKLGIAIVDAPDVIGMSEAPAAALRRKPRASVRVAADLVARRDAAALVSLGHTGATVMAAHAAFGMINGVDRPALAATIPTRGRPAVLLDAGANVECRSQHLLQFGVMGSVVARVAFGVERPSVGLLSIGEETSRDGRSTAAWLTWWCATGSPGTWSSRPARVWSRRSRRCLATSCAGRSRVRSGIYCPAAPSGDSGGGWTIRSTAARR